MRDLIRTIKYAARYKWLTLLVFVLGILNTCTKLVEPYILKLFFDLAGKSIKTGFNHEIYSSFLKYSFVFVGIAVTGIFINRVLMYFWVKWANLTEKELSLDTFRHVESLSLDYFGKHQTGKITEQLSRGTTAVMQILENVAFNFFPQFFFLVSASVILMTVNVYFGILVVVGIALYIAITLIFNKKLISIHDEIRNKYEKIGTVRTETIVNIRTVKSYAQEARQESKLSKLLNEKLLANLKWVKIANIMYTFRGMVNYASEFIAISAGMYLVLTGKVTLGSFILIYSYVTKAYEPMWFLTRMYDNTVKDLRSARRLFETLDTTPTVLDAAGAKNLKVKRGAIQINNLHFEYSDGDGKKILKGINLEIPAQKTVAIVGKSGSGKTTLAKLLMRFHDAVSGSICIDGVDIRDITQKSLRENISYVLQDSLLFNDTVTNNIRFGKPGAKEVDVVKAAKVANAHEFIEKLPNKYKTVVGERGVKLSGGEQQRINIARAILKNAPILILDEATSALDSESEVIIQDALYKLIQDKTTIIIAHRLSTVMKADFIVVMDKGKIVETGTHQDLVDQKGIYSKLFEIQSGGYLDTIDSELVGASK